MFVYHNVLSVPSTLWSPAGIGLTSWLSCKLYFLVFLPLSQMVSCVRCGFRLYRFLIFAFFLCSLVLRVKDYRSGPVHWSLLIIICGQKSLLNGHVDVEYYSLVPFSSIFIICVCKLRVLAHIRFQVLFHIKYWL